MRTLHRTTLLLTLANVGMLGCTETPVTPSYEATRGPELAISRLATSEKLKSIIVKYRPTAPIDRLTQVMNLGASLAFDPRNQHHISFDIPASKVEAIVAHFSVLPWVEEVIVRNDPGVKLASLPRRFAPPTSKPKEFFYRFSDVVPWGVHFTNGDLVQSVLSNSGSGVKVGVMDTGIDCTNGDISVAGGTNTTGDGLTYCDDVNINHHGTSVAGIIGALANGSGVVGMAPAASLYSIRVWEPTSLVTFSRLEVGLAWAITNGMQVLNISLTNCGNSTHRDATYEAQMASAVSTSHLIIIAAAGNGGCTHNDTISGFAIPSGVIAVGAFNPDTSLMSGAQYGPSMFISAPDSVATIGNSQFDGTSAAAPHVSGAAALMLAQGFNYAEVPTFLAYETQNKPSGTGHPRNTTRGYGFLDAGASVQITPQIASFVTDCNGVVYTGDVCHVSAHRLSTTGYAPFGFHWSIAATGGWTVTTYSTSDSTLTFTVPGDYMSSFTIEVRDSLSDAVTANHARVGLAQEIDWVVCPGGEALRASTETAATPVASPSTIVRRVFGVTRPKATRPLYLGDGGGHTDAICP